MKFDFMLKPLTVLGAFAFIAGCSDPVVCKYNGAEFSPGSIRLSPDSVISYRVQCGDDGKWFNPDEVDWGLDD